MRTIAGFVLGVIVTIAGAYAYDQVTGKAANGQAANEQAPMVNWNVVTNNWQTLEANIRATVDDVQRTVRRLTG